MAYVTDDKDVKLIVAKLKKKEITISEARNQIRALPSDFSSKPRVLEWEVQEVVK